MISAIAIDDEPKALEVIQSHATRISFLQLAATFTNPFEALEYLNQNTIELIFLDIGMPDISGLDFLAALNKKKQLIIFTTAHSEFALQSYEVEALDYLLKPFDFSRFLRSVVKAQNKLTSNARDFFFVNTGNQQRKIVFSDITMIEGNGNYVTYYVNAEQILVRSTIKDTLNNLPFKNFVQVHKSYIISLNKLEKIQDNHVIVGNERIAIGASYREDLMKVIGNR